jgi:PAS domain S-box-containing protein/putative nucleotidyltransferase with HDIG domain
MGLRIVIVEDEAVAALDIRHMLGRMGYEVAGAASSGEEALAVVASEKPDIVLMDIVLSGSMDGIQAAARIREDMDIPVVFLTAFADEETLRRARVTEPFGYVLKPCEDRELQTALEMAHYRHKVEKGKRIREQWMAATLSSIVDGIATTDMEGRITFMNPVAEALTGVSQEEARGRKLSEVLHISDEDGRPAGLEEYVLGTGRLAGLDTAFLAMSKNRRLPVEVFATPVPEGAKTMGGMVVAFRDITTRQQAVEALEESVRRLRRTLDETVTALAITAEKRDPYTAGHQQRVAALSSAIAQRLGLSESQVVGVRVSAQLHDLGKIYIPAEILSKPARLTTMEHGIMQTHVQVGYEILRGVSFPWPVAEIVLQHHERLDGSGYPRGLGNGAIMREARILSVADVVEAMSSHRPYRASLGLSQALAEIRRGRGRLYEADAVDTCLSLFEEGYSFDGL